MEILPVHQSLLSLSRLFSAFVPCCYFQNHPLGKPTLLYPIEPQLSHEPPCKHQHGHVGAQAQGRQERDRVAARLELATDLAVETFRREELALAVVPPVDGDEHDGGPVGGEEGADGVELLGEDLEDDEGK